MNRNSLIAAAAIILVIAGGIYLGKRIKEGKPLPFGKAVQQPSATPAPEISPQPITGRPRVKISTSKGDITLELRPDLAQKTVANFLGKWSQGDCDNLTFHRVEDWVVQGCDPAGDGTGGSTTLPTETSAAVFTAGSVGVARRQSPKEFSNDFQFFITKKDSSFLNGEYTYFGSVASGQDVVDRLAAGDKILSTVILSK